MELNIIGNWIANIILVSIGYFCRIVFGSDKLSTKQLIAFYLFCIGVVWIVDKVPINSVIKSGIILCAGLIIPPIIRGIAIGGDKSQNAVSSAVKRNVENISEKIDKIADVITDSDKNNNDVK